MSDQREFVASQDDRERMARIFAEVEAEVLAARAKFPWWPVDIVHAVVIVAEEAGEALQAANELRWQHKDARPEDLRKELIQTMAMCIRMLTESVEAK